MATNIILHNGATNPNDIILWDVNASNQTILPSGISSAEAFGLAAVIIQQFILPSGIASGEAFGIAVVVPGEVIILPSGISSAEAFGTAIVIPGSVIILPTGIASQEAFGTAVVVAGSAIILPSGIASGEAFGTAVVTLASAVQQFLYPTGITSQQAFGTARILRYSAPPRRNTLVVPCAAKECANTLGDLAIYNLDDALLYNGVALSLLEQCPTGYYCAPGFFPRVFTYPSGTFSVFLPTSGSGFPQVLSAKGCESVITRVAPARATAAQIAALGNSIIAKLAEQQARCDAVTLAGPRLPITITLSDLSTIYFCKDVAGAATISTSPAATQFFLQGKPSWMNFTSSNGVLTITATPPAYGDTSFTVIATGPLSTGQKTYTLTCIGIQNTSPLPGATSGAAYSEYLIADNIPGTTYLWTVTSGSLPPGLSINQDTWNLEGTATVEGSYAFTLTFTTELASCSMPFTMEVVSPGPDWASLTWASLSVFDAPPNSIASANGSANVLSFDCVGTIMAASAGFRINEVLPYSGPATNCKVVCVGGPYVGYNTSMTIRIIHSVAGILLQVDPLVSPEDVFFSVPISNPGDTITIFGFGGGTIGLIVQDPHIIGSLTFQNV